MVLKKHFQTVNRLQLWRSLFIQIDHGHSSCIKMFSVAAQVFSLPLVYTEQLTMSGFENDSFNVSFFYFLCLLHLIEVCVIACLGIFFS